MKVTKRYQEYYRKGIDIQGYFEVSGKAFRQLCFSLKEATILVDTEPTAHVIYHMDKGTKRLVQTWG